MSKVDNKDTRMMPGIVLVSSLLTLNVFTPCSSVSIVTFEQVNAGQFDICSSNFAKPLKMRPSHAFILGIIQQKRI